MLPAQQNVQVVMDLIAGHDQAAGNSRRCQATGCQRGDLRASFPDRQAGEGPAGIGRCLVGDEAPELVARPEELRLEC